ncbi:SRPBCC family protein [Sphingomonas bacterium]|uniref:SRPBCC family protein n=1 Tax=Sphingomonas bacterium TaxID=1895847 RepID=UPI0015763D30|nr:SRPBCC family protein [Sphingomonas bacterium]
MSDTRHDDAPVGTGKKGTAAEAQALFGDAAGSQTVGRAVTINRPASEVWAYYRDLSTAPTYMEGVVSVDTSDPQRPHWVAHGTGHGNVEWDAEITEDEPEKVLAWQAVGTSHANSGRATFEEVAGRGTVVTLTMSYDPVGGAVGQFVAKLFQHDPAILARRNLRRLKQLLETGEIATAARNTVLHAQGKTHE